MDLIMNKIKLLCLLLFMSLCACAYGCGSNPVMVKTKVEYIKPKLCPKPVKPTLNNFNLNENLASSNNTKVYISNFVKLLYYSKGLEDTIECYEKQINNNNKNNNKEVNNGGR